MTGVQIIVAEKRSLRERALAQTTTIMAVSNWMFALQDILLNTNIFCQKTSTIFRELILAF